MQCNIFNENSCRPYSKNNIYIQQDIQQRWNICKEIREDREKTDHPNKYGFASSLNEPQVFRTPFQVLQ